MNREEIAKTQAYWEARAVETGDDPNCTLPDYNLRHLEAQYIIRHLRPEDQALDIGCANGATTVRFAEHLRHIIGADYSSIMIAKARELHPGENVEYKVMDVLGIDAPSSHFDVVITERCLINLPDWSSQQAALHEIARVLKPGGRYLMCESFEEAFVKFAGVRAQFGMDPMKRHWHNYLMRAEYLRGYLPSLFRVVSVEKMGIYYLISRVVHPLLVHPQQPRYDADINALAVRLTLEMDPGYLADISVNGLYVLEKRDDL